MRYRGRVVAVGVTGVACLLGACGEDESDNRTIDAAKLEQEIEQSLPAKTAKVTSVSCPDDVKNDTGTTFTCRAQLSGDGTAQVAVSVTAPNEFSYSVKPGTVVLAGASLDTALEQDLAANGVPGATVNCPAKVTVKPGTIVTCPVKGAGGGVGKVSFEFSDASGSIEGSSVKTES
jgi:Domain of unknown function (DUF4333)